MSQHLEHMRVLFLFEEKDEANQLASTLKNSGMSAVTYIFGCVDEMIEHLKEKGADIVLIEPSMIGDEIKQTVTMIKNINDGVPVVVLAEERSADYAAQLMSTGVKDLVEIDNVALLMQVIYRELAVQQERRLRAAMTDELADVQKRCRLLLGSSRESIAYVVDGMHIYANESYADSFGYECPDDMEGVTLLDLLNSDTQADFKKFFKEYSSSGRREAELKTKGLRQSGDPFDVNLLFSSAEYEGERCTQVMISNSSSAAPVVSADVPDEEKHALEVKLIEKVKSQMAEQLEEEIQEKIEKEYTEKLDQATSIDSHTQLMNKAYYLKVLESRVEEAKGNDVSARCALLYISIDQIDSIRGEFGLSIADSVIAQFSLRLKEIAGKKAESGRVGESEFSVCIYEVDEKNATAYAESLREAIESHFFEVDEKTTRITASIGVTLIKRDTGDAYTILSRSMKAATSIRHEAEGNAVRFYRPPSDSDKVTANVEDNVGRASLQKAIDNNLFKILFQPIISLRGSEGELYEVLLRLINDDGKELSPFDFLSKANKANFTEKIDRWVILQSIKSLAARRAQAHDTRIIINLSAKSLLDKTLVPWLKVALNASRLPKDVVVFQLNQEDVTSYLKQAIHFSQQIKSLNCKMSISRFGSQEQSQELLGHLDADFIKLDGSHIKSLSQGEDQEGITGLVQGAHDYGRTIIAPFVESAGVLSTLWQLGVNYIQGYYLQPPMDSMGYDFSQGQ